MKGVGFKRSIALPASGLRIKAKVKLFRKHACPIKIYEDDYFSSAHSRSDN
jgi:hypothetical protein